MSMYLAAILGLLLTTPSVAAVLFRLPPRQLTQETQPPPQDSPQNAAPASPSAEPPQSGAEPQGEPSAKPQTTATPETTQEPEKAKPDAAAKKPASSTKASSRKRHRRKASASNSTATPAKKVVRNGGTADPAVQLAPGVSAEQASSQRQNTTQLLA